MIYKCGLTNRNNREKECHSKRGSNFLLKAIAEVLHCVTLDKNSYVSDLGLAVMGSI